MIQLISEKQCKKITSLSKATRWRLEQKGLFPLRRNVGGRIGWLSSEIEDWIRQLPTNIASEPQKPATLK